MNKFKFLLQKNVSCFIAFMCVFTFVINAEEIENKSEEKIVLTLEDALDYSNKNSVSLKTAQIDFELEKFKKNTAWNTFLPNVSLTGTLSRQNSLDSLSIPDSMKTESLHWATVGNLSASLSFNVAMISSMRATIAAYETGVITYIQAVTENENNVKKLFYGLLLQQESLAISNASLQNAKERMDQARTNYRNGYIPEISYLQSQVAYENQVPTVEKQQMALRQSLDTFAFLIGIDTNKEIELSGEINPTILKHDEQPRVNKGLQENLTIKSLRENLRVVKLQNDALNLSSFTPSLSLNWSGNPILSNALDTDWLNNDNWKDNGSFSITLAWNITNMLPWSSNRVSAKEVSNSIQKLELQLDSLVQKTELDIRTACDTLRQCEHSIDNSQRNLDLAQRSYDMTWLAYRNGTTEYLNLKEAQTQLDQAKLGLVSEKYNYITSLMELETLINSKLTGEK